MAISNALYSSRSEEWETPQVFFGKLNDEFVFTLDAAATQENAKCTHFIDKDINALNVNWNEICDRYTPLRRVIFCNPPYGRDIGKWFAKAREAQADGATVVMLAHARTDTIWWHTHVQGIASEVRFVKGRLKFVGPDGVKSSAPFPSAVIIYRAKKG